MEKAIDCAKRIMEKMSFLHANYLRDSNPDYFMKRGGGRLSACLANHSLSLFFNV